MIVSEGVVVAAGRMVLICRYIGSLHKSPYYEEQSPESLTDRANHGHRLMGLKIGLCGASVQSIGDLT